MTYQPFHRPVWAYPAQWPIDRGSHIHLARAVNELGAALYSDWAGDEGTAWIIPQPSITDRRSVLALLSRDPTYSPMAEANEIADYSRALMILTDLNAAAQPLVDRFSETTKALHLGIVDGDIRSFVRRSSGLDPIHADLWFNEEWSRVFLDCEWTVHKSVVPVKYPVYLDRADFKSFLIAKSRAAAAPPPNSGERKTMLKALMEIMRESPDCRSHTNDQLKAEIELRVGLKPSKDTFTSIKAEALEETQLWAWRKAGAPKSTGSQSPG